ncbi:hypothetical protein [Lacipirellula sp.]|uniref:hypothetical protein n=1 Tax=Lacipirellula sp. TaxID=2691419 RepID=UPI003D137E32
MHIAAPDLGANFEFTEVIMFRKRLTVGAFVACAAALVGIVSAQQVAEPSGARRAVDKAQDAAEAVGDRVGDAFNGAKEELLRGTVVMFQGTPSDNQEVNNSGLIIVSIPDSQSRQPQHISVKPQPERDFQHLGQVQGMNAMNGQPQVGGGFTFDLWRPRNECDATFMVTYTPNGASEPIEQTYRVRVVAPEKKVQ